MLSLNMVVLACQLAARFGNNYEAARSARLVSIDHPYHSVDRCSEQVFPLTMFKSALAHVYGADTQILHSDLCLCAPLRSLTGDTSALARSHAADMFSKAARRRTLVRQLPCMYVAAV